MFYMLGVRLDPELDRLLSAAAKRHGRSKSDLVRDAVRRYLEDPRGLAAEARRQSLLVSTSRAERDALDFIADAADDDAPA